MIVLGISAFYHDSAAALTENGVVIAAAQEERFTRNKHDDSFPVRAIRYCLDEAGLTLDQVDAVGFYDKPLLTFDRLLETYIAYAPSGLGSFIKAMPVWVKKKLLLKSEIEKGLRAADRGPVDPDKIQFGFHHHSHAASTFFPSPFEESAVLIMDGVGEWATTSIGVGRGNRVDLNKEIRFPHSLGMLYSAFTYYLGFKVNEGEYKVMGLAPYGEPTYEQTIRDHLIDLRDDGSFRLNMDYFNYCTGLTMTNDRFSELFGAPPHNPATPLGKREADLARSLQVVIEDAVLRLGHHIHAETGMKNLCLAGGVALNCVANGRLWREGPFENIWIQPASGDAGGALGVALAITHHKGGIARPALDDNARDHMRGSYLGPEFDNDEIKSDLDSVSANYTQMSRAELSDVISNDLAEGRVVGWFNGRMEFGPRALGNRSILGDPRSPKMQRTLNMQIKYRESFRPFAPAVLAEDVSEYFEHEGESPYMLIVADVKKDRRRELSAEEQTLSGIESLKAIRSDLPAITHVDYSARIQTVHADTNKDFYDLISAFKKRTGYGVIVNTSFNVRDEPIVCTPLDAYRCFMGTEMDVLVVGEYVLRKEEQ